MKKKNEEKIYGMYGIPSSEMIYTSLQSWKRKRGRKE